MLLVSVALLSPQVVILLFCVEELSLKKVAIFSLAAQALHPSTPERPASTFLSINSKLIYRYNHSVVKPATFRTSRGRIPWFQSEVWLYVNDKLLPRRVLVISVISNQYLPQSTLSSKYGPIWPHLAPQNKMPMALMPNSRLQNLVVSGARSKTFN